MKRTMKTLAFVAVAAMGLTACQNDFEEQVEAKDSVVVTFVADSADTRTSVDTSGDTPLFAWGENETFAVLEQTDALAAANSVTFENKKGKAHISAEFATNEGKDSYSYVTVYPASGYVSAENISAATLTLPAEQTMVEGSYDPAADLMVSEVKTATAQPTEAQMVGFHRIAAVVKMSISNLAIGADEQIEKVEFMADGQQLAGEIVVDLENPATFTPGAGSNFVSVATTASDLVYFTVLPTILAEGDTYSVAVVTNKYLYIKQGTIPDGKSLEFQSGMVTRFGVNMADALPGAKWVLVRDASTLKQNDVVTIAAKNYNYVIGKPSSSVYPLASQTEAIKVGNYLYHNPADATADHMLQSYTLMKRDENRNAFDFYNGVDFEGDANKGFAWANGSNNTPKLQSFCDKNTLFDVSIAADGVATITASEISGSYKYWRYYHNKTYATSRKFDLTSSPITADANKILLYKLEGAVGSIPTVAANVTVPDSDESVVIAEEGATTATAISDVVFNYVGDWTITPTAADAWLNVAYDATNNCLTYTAEPNTGAKRETTVTITATLEGKEPLTWSFKVIQKGAPQEISIAEFVKLEKDENSTYRITGRITEMTTSSSGTFKLTDGTNVATVTYLYTDGGVKVSGNQDINVAVGDVMTVTTVPVGSGKGGNSTHYSTYKGHYGFKTTLGAAADYTGGAVTIEVETYSNGSIVVPEAVEATMETNDFAELSYSGGDTATVTFTSENTTTEAREAVVTFTYGQASDTVIAQQGINPANKLGYELVTDASTLAVGDEVIIVAKNSDKALACPTKDSDTKLPSADIEKTGNVVYDVEEAGVQVLTLGEGASDGTMALELIFKEVGYRLQYSSGLKMRNMNTYPTVNAASSWTIDINKETGEATIVNSSKDYHIKFNSATSSLTFTCYLSTATNATKKENAICIYKKQVKK